MVEVEVEVGVEADQIFVEAGASFEVAVVGR